MKVYAVCGFGVGSSMILKLSLDKVFKELGIECEVENTDINNASGASVNAIFTSPELYENLYNECNGRVYPIKRYMDLEEVKGQVNIFLKDIDR